MPSRSLSLPQRIAIAIVPGLAALAIAAIGITLRYETLLDEGAYAEEPPTSGIYCFWHQCVFLAGWYFHTFRCSILISRSFDGELVTRALALLGYGAERGSSSRGGATGLLRLKSVIERGDPVVFVADGPRGPIYKAKLGPIKLAQMTGEPVGGFFLLAEHGWTLNSWDRFMIPRPFSRAVVSWARKVPAPPPDASDIELEAARLALDAALERARRRAEAYFPPRASAVPRQVPA